VRIEARAEAGAAAAIDDDETAHDVKAEEAS
jgi:hypothetical protein